MLIKKVISPFLLLLYITTIVGIAYYDCHCEHSNSIALFAQDECSCAHEHEHATAYSDSACADADCNHTQNNEQTACLNANTNDGGCCKVIYKSFQIDQDNTVQQAKSLFNTSFLTAFILPTLISVNSQNDIDESFDFSKSPPDGCKTAIIYLNRQLRL